MSVRVLQSYYLAAASTFPVVALDTTGEYTPTAFAVDKPGDVVVAIQHTFDDVLTTSTGQTWADHSICSAVAAGSAANTYMEGGYSYPISAIRCVVVSCSTATNPILVKFWVNQW